MPSCLYDICLYVFAAFHQNCETYFIVTSAHLMSPHRPKIPHKILHSLLRFTPSRYPQQSAFVHHYNRYSLTTLIVQGGIFKPSAVIFFARKRAFPTPTNDKHSPMPTAICFMLRVYYCSITPQRYCIFLIPTKYFRIFFIISMKISLEFLFEDKKTGII